MTTYRQFFNDVLVHLGAPESAGNLDALATVTIIEGTNDRFNPLNSVVPYGNSTEFNSVGVQDYKSFDNGVLGTVKLLEGSPWTHVLAELKADAGTHAVLTAFANEYATWGSHPDFFGVNVTEAANLLNETMPGSTPTPTPIPVHHRTYRVQRGDTLTSIAEHFYHNADWQKIYDANKHVIGSNPNLIQPGEVLVIP